MKRKLLIVALAIGSASGFAAGFASLGCHASRARAFRHHHVKNVVTNICADAIKKAQKE